MKEAKALAILIVILSVTATAHAAGGGGVLWKYRAEDIVYGASSSADGETLAIGSRDSHVYLFDRRGNLRWKYPTDGTVYSVSSSADGKLIAAGSEDKHLYLLDDAGKLLLKVKMRGPLNSVSASGDGGVIAVASGTWSGGYMVNLFDRSGESLWEFKTGFVVRSVAVSGNGQVVAAGSDEGNVYLFDRSGKELWAVQPGYPILSVAASADGGLIAAGSEDGKIHLFDRDGKTLWEHQVGDRVNAVAISSDGKTVAAGARNKSLYILDRSGKLLRERPVGAEVHAVSSSADGGMLMVGSADGIAYALDVPATVAARAAGVVWRYAAFIGAALVLAGSVGAGLYLGRTARGREAFRERTAGARRLMGEVWRHRISYWFLIPTIALLAVFNYYPAFSGLYHAFTEWNPGISTRLVGLANFREMLRDRFLWVGVTNLGILIATAFFKVLTVPLLVAELIFHLRSLRAQYWMRVSFVIPVVVPTLVSILVWTFIYDPNIGLLNNFLRSVGLPGYTHVWLGEVKIALASIIFVGFPWVGVFSLLIYLSGLISIPQELFDAATVDGVSALGRFRHIDLPLLLGQVRLLVVLTFIGTMQEFFLILIMTGGGPYSSTYVPALELYYAAFRFSKFGYASAIALVLFAIIMAVTILNMRFRSAIEYQA